MLLNKNEDFSCSFRWKKIITFHEAFPYFAKEFGFEISAVIEQEPGTVPSAKELAKIIESIKSVTNRGEEVALFAEPQYSSSVAKIISNETGLSVYELDPCVNGQLEKTHILKAWKKSFSFDECFFRGKN